MSRLPYAAKRLAEQVVDAKPRTKVEPVEDSLDGLGVYRTVRFSRSGGKWLQPLLEEIGDPRIISLSSTDDGLDVTFVGTPLADNRDPFPLDAAVTLLRGE